MEISNFRLKEIAGNSPLNYMFYAVVNVKTGFLWWKKSEDRVIARGFLGVGDWAFLDNGEYVGIDSHVLEKNFLAKNKLSNLEHCTPNYEGDL